MVKQFKDAKEGHFFACTPRATIHAHHGDGSNVTSRHHHDDGLQSFIHAYPVKDGHGIKVGNPTRRRDRMRDGLELEEITFRAGSGNTTFS